MRAKRLMQILITSVFALVGLFALAAAIGGGASWVLAIVPFAMACAAFFSFELQIRSLKAGGVRARASIEAIAAKLFDRPGQVRRGYDLSVTAGATGGAVLGAMEADEGFTTDGECRGARVSIASHASSLGRQMGEWTHTYSHVVVDCLGLTQRFRLYKEGAAAKLAQAAGLAKDAQIGDAAFDQAWTVDADEGLAKDVLDDSIRARLTELRARVGQVSLDVGPGTMSVVLTPHGLALRWPGEIDVALATYIRDLLLDMRARVLAHADRAAVRVADGAAYRVASEAPAEEESEEPDQSRARTS